MIKRIQGGGDRNRMIVHERRTMTKDSFGQPLSAWTPLGPPEFSRIRGVSGKEIALAAGMKAVATHCIEKLYVRDVLTTDRFLYGTREFYVTYVRNVDEQGREHYILVNEAVPTS